jgi:hypothetical protein
MKNEVRPTTMQADRFKDVFSEDNIASKISMTGTNGGKI